MVCYMNWKNITPFVPFFQKISDPSDDYELGIAYSSNVSGQESFLLSYNPRIRNRAFRIKIGKTFRYFGFPLEPLHLLDGLFLPHQCSWVLGLEQGKTLRTTIYIEELSQFISDDRLQHIVNVLGKKWNLPPLTPPAIGKPYILAVDIQSTGIQFLKQYNFVPFAERHSPVPQQHNKPLLIQTRSGCPQEKIYSCYPYLQSETPEAWNDWNHLAQQYKLNPQPFEQMPITSLGIRLTDTPDTFCLYGCVVRPKGSNNSSSSPNN